MKINIETIPHDKHRYSTCGDWWTDPDGTLQIRVSQLSDRRYEALVVIHELVEVLIEGTKRAGKLDVPHVFVREADDFDKAYERDRKPDDNESEPGCDLRAPYYQGHMAASAIENIAAMLLEVDYNDYAFEIASLS